MGGTGPDRREAAAGVRGSVDRGIVCAVGRTVGNSRAALQVGTVRDVPQPLYSSQLGAQCINVRAAAALLRTVDSLIIERHVVGSCKDWSYLGIYMYPPIWDCSKMLLMISAAGVALLG